MVQNRHGQQRECMSISCWKESQLQIGGRPDAVRIVRCKRLTSCPISSDKLQIVLSGSILHFQKL